MKTALFDLHQKNGAKFIDFCGWEMPLLFQGIVPECLAVRSAVGLFDVSHMGKIDIFGEDALPFLDFLSSNAILGSPIKKAIYTVFCNESGGAIDDSLVYPLSSDRAFVVANAVNRTALLNHFNRKKGRYRVEITPSYENTGIIALQGPKSSSLLCLIPSFPRLAEKEVCELSSELIFSRTGYTGEDGYEFYGSEVAIRDLFKKLIDLGKPLGLLLSGLGARDVLRLEKGYPLYGHELSSTIAPVESVVARFVHLEGRSFLGKEALEAILKSKSRRYAVGIIGVEKIPARDSYPIYSREDKIGIVTSGTFSPHLQAPIALTLVNREMKAGEEVRVEIREKQHPFLTVALPFIRKSH